MNSEEISKLKKKLKELFADKEIIDIIVFGSFIKGKTTPNDIDIAIITDQDKEYNLKNMHVSIIKPKEIFIKNPPSLINTILREGYSLKNNKFLSETLKFENKVLFSYNLLGLSNSEKVKTVNILRSKNNSGLVKENSGEWLANQVFIVPVNNSSIFEKLFLNLKIKYKKSYVLMH